MVNPEVYRQITNMMTQMLMFGMLGGVAGAPRLLMQAGKKTTVKDLEAKIAELEARLAEVEGKPARKPLFGGRSAAVPIIDTNTKKVYHSKFTTGKELCGEVGATPEDKFAWYKLTAKFPKRFREASDAEIERAKKAGTYLQTEGG